MYSSGIVQLPIEGLVSALTVDNLGIVFFAIPGSLYSFDQATRKTKRVSEEPLEDFINAVTVDSGGSIFAAGSRSIYRFDLSGTLHTFYHSAHTLAHHHPTTSASFIFEAPDGTSAAFFSNANHPWDWRYLASPVSVTL